MKYGFVGIALCCAVVPSGWAQSPPQAPTPVHLEITADESLAARLRSGISAELKSIPGLTVSDDTPALTLAVIAVEQKMSDGQMIGYLVYEGGYQPGPQCWALTPTDPANRPVVITWQTLRMLTPDFKKACHRIADDFNTEVVVPTRALMAGAGRPLGGDAATRAPFTLVLQSGWHLASVGSGYELRHSGGSWSIFYYPPEFVPAQFDASALVQTFAFVAAFPGTKLLKEIPVESASVQMRTYEMGKGASGPGTMLVAGAILERGAIGILGPVPDESTVKDLRSILLSAKSK
jgi:hypothetical protein